LTLRDTRKTLTALTLLSALAWLAIDVADPLQKEHAPAPVENGTAVIRAL